MSPDDDATALTPWLSQEAGLEPELGELPLVDPHRYEDRLVLGQGGMGTVWLAWDRVLACPVVRKVMRSKEVPAWRFVHEARITARLQHPGIVAVHDLGRLEDGRLSYTMRQVRGVSLDEPIRAYHRGEDPAWTLRRLVGVFRRVCETVAYAHSQGVVHRDLKPANLMVGEFGAVRVVDWGLAKELGRPDPIAQEDGAGEGGHTLHGAVLGTPAYMSPEQERGEEVGLSTDVFALGAVLHAVLFGHPRRRAEGAEAPSELVALCALAMDPEAARRPGAQALATGVEEWLEGLRRRERGLALVAEAQDLLPGVAALRGEAIAKREQARLLLAGLAPEASPEDKRPAWEAEDEADALEERAEQRSLETVRLLHAALREDRHLDLAHALLADHYQARHAEAEARRDLRATLASEAQLAEHDRGRHAAWLQGHGAVSLVTDPPGAEVRLFALEARGRRLEPVAKGVIGHTPLVEHSLPRGSYLLELHASGCEVVRYPVAVGRLEHWDGVPPGGREPAVVVLPRVGELGPEDCYLPAGWASLGGDHQALDPLPAARRWVEACVLRRNPLRHRELLALLDGLLAAGEDERALSLTPRRRPGLGGATLSYRVEGGRFLLDEGQPGQSWLPEGPAVELDWRQAMGVAALVADLDGLPWRLPHELEREKAARGVDGRFLPWGDHFEAGWARVLDSQRGPPAAGTVGEPPEDRSIYGVQGLVGNVRDWCLNAYAQEGLAEGWPRVALVAPAPEDPAYRSSRGGTFSSHAALCRPATRTGARPDGRFAVVGVRLCRSYPAGSPSG